MNTQAPVDLIALLKEDHQLVKQRFAEVDRAGTETKAERFWVLTDQLVRHEVAEEIVVYPALRALSGGDRIADSRIEEQSEAEQKLADIEKLEPGSPEFTSELGLLERAVLQHAEREEGEVFPLLSSSQTSESLLELGQKYMAAKTSAPNHPHPHAPDTPPGNKIMGPVAALFDRIRDAAARV